MSKYIFIYLLIQILIYFEKLFNKVLYIKKIIKLSY